MGNGALEKNKKQVKQGQCNVDTKKAKTNNKKTLNWKTNLIEINEYEVNNIKAGYMNVMKETSVHTCNASNNTFGKIHFLKQHITAKVFLQQKIVIQKLTLYNATHKLCHNVYIREVFFFLF